ncbi:hypothetical protein NHX12_015134 [Muraenolepis orangiensis]|uniref:Uncharacterized protein n=1 Tax=Muraenolepis orangiensis TaxID=630683 RepID=A0A9Q0D9Z2_9TELE|nr:hypothetical protein NHX12_015134 [Muraenolepis orangiensis]
MSYGAPRCSSSAAGGAVLKLAGLEDVDEEEEASLTQQGTPRCKIVDDRPKGGAQGGVKLSVSHMESEFLQLTIRKQVSYR